MKTYTFHFPAILVLLLLFSSCGTTDTVQVVDREPRSSTRADTTDDRTTEQFKQLTVGVIDPVENFDPLFADNLSTQRVLSLIYDGLFTLDRDGDPIPAIARDVEVSDDGLEYTIKINRDLFFHDNRAFLSGVGRRIHATDIKWAFERTARANVPPTAAKLLMNIEGYESYFNEQRYLFENRKRILDGVSGIIVDNPETIRFQLVEPDSDFTKKLASPYLFIYPREGLRDGFEGIANRPVGTGAYKFQRKEQNGTITLSRDDSQRFDDRLTNPRVNRIDFVYRDRERDLFQEFAREEIDWIPEIGLSTSLLVTDADGELRSSYEGSFNATRHTGTRSTYLHFNNSADRANMKWLKHRVADADFSTFHEHAEFDINVEQIDADTTGEADSTYFAAYTVNLFVRSILSGVSNQILAPESEINLVDIRVPTSEVAIYSGSSDSFHDTLLNNTGFWLKITTPITALNHNDVEEIRSHNVPWKIFMEPIRVPAEERDPS